MIVDINIKQLGTLIIELNDLIDECEESELNIFYQLKDACLNWQDENSLLFEGQIKNEKQNTQYFLSVIQNDRDLFKLIYDEYKSIGNKLYFNLSKKEEIIKYIDICITKANAALYELDSVDRSFYYSELKLIDNQKNSIVYLKNELMSMKNKIISLYNRIKNTEERVAAKISRLEDIKISAFSFSFQ